MKHETLSQNWISKTMFYKPPAAVAPQIEHFFEIKKI